MPCIALSNISAKDMIYEVVYKDGDGGKGTIVEEVSEDKLAYGANCPVTVSINPNEDGSDEGTVLLCEPSSSDPGKFLYTVMILMEGSQARFESGIDAKCIKYRKVKTDTENAATTETAAASPVAASVQKEQPSATNNDPSTAKISVSASAVHPDEGRVPSSITCDSVSKSSSKEVGAGSSNKRKHTPDIASPLTATPKRKLRVDTTPANNNAPYKPDIGRSINSYSHDNISSSRGMGNHDTRMEMKIPVWLQRDRQSQRDLFFHLIGSKLKDKRGKRTANHVERETHCCITMNYNKSPGYRDNVAAPPISLTIDARSHTSTLRDLNDAREKIQELLLDYMDVILDGGSKGRLIYEVASSCGGDHRPRASTSYAVRANDSFMSLVELPFLSQEGRRFHASFLLQHPVLIRMKGLNCRIKVCGDEFRVPLKFCDPHVIITGRHWQDVDRAVEIVKDAIGRHMSKCSCAFLLLS